MLREIPLENPRNRWESTSVEYDDGELPDAALQVFEDDSVEIVSENDSPDVSFRYGINPYRGCAHGCAYCYARPSHEYLGFGSGSDFERRIVIKPRAAELLRARFERRSWQGDLLVVSGNTDCYQPLEARFELTRRCLAVCAEYRNPVHIITKSALVERDVDILAELHAVASISVSISITFWDESVSRAIEPYAPPPRRRVETIRRLARAGIPVIVHVAPLIPGLADKDLIPILEAAREAGAGSALTIPLRLPGSTAEVFESRLRRHLPLVADKVLRRVREMHGGRLYDPRFFARMRGEGEYQATLQRVFEATALRLGFGPHPQARLGTFRRPTDAGGQLRLFDR